MIEKLVFTKLHPIFMNWVAFTFFIFLKFYKQTWPFQGLISGFPFTSLFSVTLPLTIGVSKILSLALFSLGGPIQSFANLPVYICIPGLIYCWPLDFPLGFSPDILKWTSPTQNSSSILHFCLLTGCRDDISVHWLMWINAWMLLKPNVWETNLTPRFPSPLQCGPSPSLILVVS